MSALINGAISYASWAFLPRIITDILQSTYYTYRPSPTPPPPPGTPQHARDRRRIYLLVIVSYLLYTLYSTYATIQSQGDFYALLGVTPLSTEREIKSRYRRLATLFHPDKLRQTTQGDDEARTAFLESQFMRLKAAYETLLDPTKKFVYDRFGVVVANSAKEEAGPGSAGAKLQRLMGAALLKMAPQYAMSFAVLVGLNVLWFPAHGRYWRFYSFFALLTLELLLLTRPNSTLIPAAYLPAWLASLTHLDKTYLLPFQTLSLLQQANIAISIFISQTAPVSSRNDTAESKLSSGGVLSPQAEAQLARLVALAAELDAETTRLNGALEAPYADAAQPQSTKQQRERLVAEFRRGMRGALLEQERKAAPEVVFAVERALERLGKGAGGAGEGKGETEGEGEPDAEMRMVVARDCARRFTARLSRGAELRMRGARAGVRARGESGASGEGEEGEGMGSGSESEEDS